MNIFLGILAAVFASLWLVTFIVMKITQRRLAASEAKLQQSQDQAVSTFHELQRLADQQFEELRGEGERLRAHYEAEAGRIYDESRAMASRLEPLRKYEGVLDVEAEARRVLDQAIEDAAKLRVEAEGLFEQARAAAKQERLEAVEAGKELRSQSEALLIQTSRDAARLLRDAEAQAEQIAGDAYYALREKQLLEQSVKAIRNVVDGYGDRYVVPTHSLLDELAQDFGHTAAGEALKVARYHSRQMVEDGEAAECSYAETNRRETAIRFVIDAFNGRVDGILSRVKHDNMGTLEQEIRDAFNLVNLNGKAFRDARIRPAYLDSRLAELKWAVVAQELRMKEREEQRRIKEQMREEEKARREYERAVQEAQKEEDFLKKAMEKARQQADHASAEERQKYEAQLAELQQKLTEAEAKNQRALSMAQQTRKGNVYIISNIGSFGEEVFKIGMTRRLEPMDRIKELSDASVPFEFDVHAIISSDDAPALESLLHREFDDFRINKVNYRKEFFRLPLERLRSSLTQAEIEASFTMVAEAREYRETQALNRMTPEERQRYRIGSVDRIDVED